MRQLTRKTRRIPSRVATLSDVGTREQGGGETRERKKRENERRGELVSSHLEGRFRVTMLREERAKRR